MCARSCGGSGTYKLLVVVGGDNVTSFGYSLRASEITPLSNASGDGSRVHAMSSRSFDGTTLHAAAHNERGGALGGVSFTSGGVHHARAEDMLVGLYWKPGGSSGTMTLQGPGFTHGCGGAGGCTIVRGPPGDYRFEHSQTDLNGREAFLLYADVPAP